MGFGNKILDQSNIKDFADNKINVTRKLNFNLGRVENIVGKGENAANLLFSCDKKFKPIILLVLEYSYGTVVVVCKHPRESCF